MKGWSLSRVKKLKKAGKIRCFRITRNSKKADRMKHLQKVGKQKYWMELVLVDFCKQNGYTLIPEFQFHPKRKWRFDFFVQEVNLGLEYEGIFADKSRHTNVIGYSNDAMKYNEATKLGYDVIRYTALNYKNLLSDLSNYSQHKSTRK